jgi:glycosyltransferase involved in cell wall biosynthesis
VSTGESGVLVDVGIPTGGRGTYLGEAVGSVLAQTVSRISVKVGENGAGTAEVRAALEPFLSDSRLRHIVHGVDHGPAGNYMRVAQGDAPYLAILHDDDRWDPEFLERRVAFLEHHPLCGFVFSRSFLIDGNGNYLDVWDDVLAPGVHSSETFLPAIYRRNIVSVPTAVVRRSAYEGIGAEFHELLFNDHEFWLRLGAKYDVGYLPTIDAAYRLHGNQATSANRRRLGEHRMKFYEAVDGLTGAAVPEPVRRRSSAEVHMHVAAEALDRGEGRTALAELARAATLSPATVASQRGRRRAAVIVAATLLGPVGRGLWHRRRDFGRRRADAIGARRAATALRESLTAHEEPLLFSVVIPAHNAARTIGQAIDSVLIQSCQKFELIVVDDGSTDDTARVAQQAARDRIQIVHQDRSGVSAARNRGLELARAPWVSFLDADDLWLPAYLAKMEAAVRRDPDLGLIFTDAWVFDESVRRIRRQPMMAPRRPSGPLPEDPAEFLTALLVGNFVYTSATAAREALVELGGYAAELTHAEDYDLWLRLAATGRRSAFIPGPLAIYRIGSDASLSKSRREMARSELHVLQRLLEHEKLPAAQEAIAEARIQRMAAFVAYLEEGEHDRRSFGTRLRDRVARMKGGTLYRSPPPEVLGAFPELVGARPAEHSFVYA